MLPDPIILLALIKMVLVLTSPIILCQASYASCMHGFDMIVEILLSLNVLVNAQSQFGNTPLIIGVDFSKNPNIVQLLLSPGAA